MDDGIPYGSLFVFVNRYGGIVERGAIRDDHVLGLRELPICTFHPNRRLAELEMEIISDAMPTKEWEAMQLRICEYALVEEK